MLRRMPRRVDPTGLNLTSMMDLFTIILTFLLNSLATTDVSVRPSAELQLPFASSAEPVELAVNVVVTREQILVDGAPVVPLVAVPDQARPGVLSVDVPGSARASGVIQPLLSALVERAELARRLGEASGREDHTFKGRVLLQCDRELPYALVRDVMLTAGQAGFGEFQFVVYKRD